MLPSHISEMVISISLDEQRVKDQFQMMVEYILYIMKYFMINILIRELVVKFSMSVYDCLVYFISLQTKTLLPLYLLICQL